jgi:5-formyltetrahydrofolate cyclo-ligase
MARTKEEWRQRLSEARRALAAPLRAAHSQIIAARVASTPEFAASDALLVYVPIGAEVDPMALVRDGQRKGQAVYRPHGEAIAPRWLRYRPVNGAASDDLDGLQPVVVPEETALLVIVPAMGFDLEGVRLGRGGGFYDRALARLRDSSSVFAVGIAFEAQVVERLPCDPWDQGVDLIVTEQRCIVPHPSLARSRPMPQAEEVREP